MWYSRGDFLSRIRAPAAWCGTRHSNGSRSTVCAFLKHATFPPPFFSFLSVFLNFHVSAHSPDPIVERKHVSSARPCFDFLVRAPEDEFLILASDGVWDVIDNPGIVAFLAAEVMQTRTSVHLPFSYYRRTLTSHIL